MVKVLPAVSTTRNQGGMAIFVAVTGGGGGRQAQLHQQTSQQRRTIRVTEFESFSRDSGSNVSLTILALKKTSLANL